MLIDESSHQNLISGTTVRAIWSRHLLDSAQLLPLADDHPGTWLDVGSGAGLPGLVIAILSDRPVVLVEPRGRRALFLQSVVDALGIGARVDVIARKIEAVRVSAVAVVSARAVAALPDLLRTTHHCTNRKTLWVLPKGRSGQSEVADARKAWHGSFHVEQSLTQADSSIVIAKEVSPR